MADLKSSFESLLKGEGVDSKWWIFVKQTNVLLGFIEMVSVLKMSY